VALVRPAEAVPMLDAGVERSRVVFPALVWLRRSHPQRPRPFRLAGGHAGAWIASGLATGWSALAVPATLWPGLGTADPDAYLPLEIRTRVT
jgi:hypothetical protein